jgi:hypothetical protein
MLKFDKVQSLARCLRLQLLLYLSVYFVGLAASLVQTRSISAIIR